MKCKWNLKLHLFDTNFIPIYMFALYYVFFQKKYLKAISKVNVNFNELHVKFNMQSFKNGFR